MIFKKQVLGNIEKCYATCIGEVDGQVSFIGASEGPSEARAYVGSQELQLWNGPGGSMNILPVPGKANEFYGTQKFLPVFAAEECTLNYIVYKDGTWTVKEVQKFPYLHRFDLYEVKGDVYFMGATLCSGKEFVQDWSKPGAVYAGKLNRDLSQAFEPRQIYTGITKNHGFCRVEGASVHYLITGVEGVFDFEVPTDPMADDWKIQQLMSHEVSDIAVCDIDGDGIVEYATIEPFHGNRCVIYKDLDGELKAVKEYPIEFGHVIWGGQLAGEASFLLGYRKEAMELSRISMKKGEFNNELIEANVGPSQLSVYQDGEASYILSANRQIDELAVYRVTK